MEERFKFKLYFTLLTSYQIKLNLKVTNDF